MKRILHQSHVDAGICSFSIIGFYNLFHPVSSNRNDTFLYPINLSPDIRKGVIYETHLSCAMSA